MAPFLPFSFFQRPSDETQRILPSVRLTADHGDPLFSGLRGEGNALKVYGADGRVWRCRGRGAGRWATTESIMADLAEIVIVDHVTEFDDAVDHGHDEAVAVQAQRDAARLYCVARDLVVWKDHVAPHSGTE